MMLSKKELLEFSEDSTDIYKWNMANRYQIRPYEDIIDKLCYALFLKLYQLEQKQIEHYFHPDELVDEIVEINQASVSSYPKFLNLSSGENSRWCKFEVVLPCHVPNQHKDLERYAHHLR